MNTDNWATCPKCMENNKRNYDQLKAEIELSYGAIPMDEFKLLEKKLDEFKTPVEQTLKEDCEFYMNEDGILDISYSAKCSVCGTKYI